MFAFTVHKHSDFDFDSFLFVDQVVVNIMLLVLCRVTLVLMVFPELKDLLYVYTFVSGFDVFL